MDIIIKAFVEEIFISDKELTTDKAYGKNDRANVVLVFNIPCISP